MSGLGLLGFGGLALGGQQQQRQLDQGLLGSPQYLITQSADNSTAGTTNGTTVKVDTSFIPKESGQKPQGAGWIEDYPRDGWRKGSAVAWLDRRIEEVCVRL